MTMLHAPETRSNARRVRMNSGTPWWDASERLREVLDEIIGLTRLRVDRHFHSLTATYEVIRDDGVPVHSPPATASIPIRLNGQVIGDVLVQDGRRRAYDEPALAAASQIVAAFAAGFEDPSAVVRAKTTNREERR